MRLCPALACAALFTASAISSRASSAPDPTVSLTRAQSADFQKALTALSDEGHCPLVAEGTPLKAHLTGKAAPDLTTPEPLGRAVSALAAAYDYDAARDDDGVFVLTKRYTDPKDLPGVTLPECVQAAKNVLQVLDTFNPHVPTSIRQDNCTVQIMQFVSTLSPEQEQAMQAKTLYYGDLSPDQQTLIQRLFLYQYVQTQAGLVQQTLSNMEAEAHSPLTGHDDVGNTALCVEMTIGPDAIVKTSRDGKHYMLPLYSPSGTPAAPPASHVAPAPQTLAAVVAGLGPISGAQPTVDAPLRDKPVTVVGLATVAPMDALRALKAVYGLRIGATLQGAPQLEMPPAPVPASPREISADVWAALPAPLARAAHFQEGNEARVPSPGGKDMAAYRKWQQEDDQRWQRRWNLMQRPADLARAASARVWEAVQPQLRAVGPDARVSVSSLDAPTRGALAVALVSSMMNSLYDYYGGQANKSVLNGLDNLDHMRISGNPEQDPNVPGKMIHSLFMVTTDPHTGEIVGMGGAGYGSPL